MQKLIIKKTEFPRPRRKWRRKPVTQVVPSKKIYSRRRVKGSVRRTVKNEI